MVGGTSHQSQEWLEEAESNCHEPDDHVGIGVDGLGDVPKLQDNEDEAGRGEEPGEHHEVPVPDEPLVQVEPAVRGPGLLEVPRHDDSQTS